MRRHEEAIARGDIIKLTGLSDAERRRLLWGDGYRGATPSEKAFLVRETQRVHAEFRALRGKRVRDGAVKPAHEVFSAEFIEEFARTTYDDSSIVGDDEGS